MPAADAQSASSTSSEHESERKKYAEMYDEIWSLLDAHFLYRDRLKNWGSWRHKFDNRMNTQAEARDAMNQMIDSLGDEYTFFKDEPATEERKNLRQKTKVVDYKMLEGNIGYIRISTLSSMFCVSETRNALIDLSNANAYIIDLRDNWGGSINTTFDVFSLLTNTGKFVTMKGTTDSAQYEEALSLSEDSAITVIDGVETRSLREFNLSRGKPLVVLVNETTKSAAEMLAGALRDNGRATVVGSRTYGKGIVQRVWEFDDNTSIKISSARYYLPGGEFVHGVGMNPDLAVSNELLLDRKIAKSKSLARRSKTRKRVESRSVAQIEKPRQTYSLVMQLQLDRSAAQNAEPAAMASSSQPLRLNGNMERVTSSSAKSTGSSTKLTGSSAKLTSSSAKLTSSSAKSTSSSAKSTGSSAKLNSSSSTLAGSSTRLTSSAPATLSGVLDRQLDKAQSLLRHKLLSLAKPDSLQDKAR